VSFITLRDLWCDIIVLNVHAPTEDKIGDRKDSFDEELERILDQFLKCNMKIGLGDFNAKVGREDIFKPESEMRFHIKLITIMVNIATLKSLIVKGTMPHFYTWTSPDEKHKTKLMTS